MVAPGTVLAHGAFNVELADALGADEPDGVAAPFLVVAADPAVDVPVSVGRRAVEPVDVPVVPTEDGDDVDPLGFVLVPLPRARASLPRVVAVVDPDAWLPVVVLDVVPAVVAADAPAPLAVAAEFVTGVHGSGVALGNVWPGWVEPVGDVVVPGVVVPGVVVPGVVVPDDP